MKRFFFWMIVAGIVVAAGAADYFASSTAGKKQDPDSLYRTMKVRRGEIRSIVTATGPVQPVLSIQVGTVRLRADQGGQVQFQRQGEKAPGHRPGR